MSRIATPPQPGPALPKSNNPPIAVDPKEPKVRLKLSTPLAGPTIKHLDGAVVTMGLAEAKRHVANGNGVILDGPDEQSEVDRLRVENAQLKQTIAGASKKQNAQA